MEFAEEKEIREVYTSELKTSNAMSRNWRTGVEPSGWAGTAVDNEPLQLGDVEKIVKRMEGSWGALLVSRVQSHLPLDFHPCHTIILKTFSASFCGL